MINILDSVTTLMTVNYKKIFTYYKSCSIFLISNNWNKFEIKTNQKYTILFLYIYYKKIGKRLIKNKFGVTFLSCPLLE